MFFLHNYLFRIRSIKALCDTFAITDTKWGTVGERGRNSERSAAEDFAMGYCLSVDSYSPISDGDCPASSLGCRSRLWQWGWRWIKGKRCCRLGDQALLDLGCGRISWRQLFWKLRAELRRMMNTRPTQGFKYDALSYAQNFDDGGWQDPDVHSFACRFSAKADPQETCKPCS